MGGRWFRIEDFYECAGDRYIFYPHLYGRGYSMSAEERRTMDRVLEPFLNGRLRLEFVAVLCFETFAFTIAVIAFLLTASNEQLDAVHALPPWAWLAGAVALAAAIVVPVVVRLRSKIRRQLDAMGLRASEPPRPDFLIVDGEFSLVRLSAVLFGVAIILMLMARM